MVSWVGQTHSSDSMTLIADAGGKKKNCKKVAKICLWLIMSGSDLQTPNRIYYMYSGSSLFALGTALVFAKQRM